MKQLTADQIAQKLTEGRNYKRLYTDLKVKYDRVTGELKAENVALRALVTEQQATIETLKIQLAELQTMVFGKKKKPPTGTSVPVLESLVAKARSKDSYHRPVPPATAITTEVVVPLPESCACGGPFDQNSHTTHERYQEDVPLPELTPDYQPHLVTRYLIQRGICTRCGKPTSGQDLAGQAVTLGPNVRLLVTHLISVGGMSYHQVASLLLALYGLSVSDGEIANLLNRQHRQWLPAYQRLKADIRAAPVRHYDETPWRIQAADNGGYAWVMSDASSPKTLFHCATSRGGRHAAALHGNARHTAVHITDDYSVYRNLPGQQQLCWAHLYRTIRDLRYNVNLPADQLSYVTWWYQQFAEIYQDLRKYLGDSYDSVVRMNQANDLWQRLQLLMTTPASGSEPKKLSLLKAQLQRAGQDRLLVCLSKNTPCDNNRAERDLRQLVLKRKRSFGSKTEQGAMVLSTILSLCTTTWRSNPTNYFSTLAALA
jgi:transposase